MTISLEKIEEILAAEDIEGLIEAGAPNSEYDTEGKEIFNRLSSTDTSISAVQSIIERVWQRSFNLSRQNIIERAEPFSNVAVKLYKLLPCSK